MYRQPKIQGIIPVLTIYTLALFGASFIGIMVAQLCGTASFGQIISTIGNYIIVLAGPTVFFLGCGILGLCAAKIFEVFRNWYIVFRPKKFEMKPVNLKDRLHPETAELVCRMMTEDYVFTRDSKTLDFLKSLYYSMGRLDEWTTLSKRFPANSNQTDHNY